MFANQCQAWQAGGHMRDLSLGRRASMRDLRRAGGYLAEQRPCYAAIRAGDTMERTLP